MAWRDDVRDDAEQGDAEAQYILGTFYEYGNEGFPQDPAQAVEWFRKAAEQGHPYAQVGLGSCYESGTGVPQDYISAYMWYETAILSIPLDAFLMPRDEVEIFRDDVAKKMTSDQIAEAQKLSREWFNKFQDS